MRKIKYSKSDFDPIFLPKNRKQVFCDCYKTRFSLILKIGVYLLLFALPSIVGIFIFDLINISINSMYSGEELQRALLMNDLFKSLTFGILFFICLVGIAGILRIIRQFVWGEGIYYIDDFKLGLKNNYKYMAISTAFIAILYFATMVVFNLFIGSFIGWVAIIIFVLIVFPIYVWALLLVNTYASSFKEYFKNALFFYIKNIFISIPLSILLFIPAVTVLLTSPTLLSLKFILIFVLVIFYYPALLIVWVLIANASFDKYLNQEFYPDYFRKGMFNPNKNNPDNKH